MTTRNNQVKNFLSDLKELINLLSSYSNQDAEINIISNIINSDEDCFDINNMNLEIMGLDKTSIEETQSLDIIITNPNEKKDKRENIHKLLQIDYNYLKIELDCLNDYSNIVITDYDGNVVRDIKVGGEFEQEVNIIKILQSIL